MEMQQRDIAVRVSRSPEDAGFEVRVGKGRPLEMPIVVEDLDCLPSGLMNRITQALAVEVRSCSLERVPSWIFDLLQLTHLDLSDNQLTDLPTEIGRLTKLTRLYLSWNQLTDLPTEIARLTKLTRLYLSRNQLTDLPTEIARLTKLTRLYLSRNQLTDLPTEIGRLTKLAWLGVSGCGLSSEAVAEVRQLVPLDCEVSV